MKDEIIDMVYNTPAVWDKRHKHHHNRHVLAKEWKKIAGQMGAAEIEVRRCWKNLRQEFGKQLRKSDFQSGETSTDDIQWPYFTKLLFLQDQFPSRKPADANGTSASASGGGIYADEQSASKNSDDVSDLDSDLYTTDDEVMPPDFLIQSSSTPPTLEQSGSRSNPPCLSPRPQRPLPIMPKPPPDNGNPSSKKRKLQQPPMMPQEQHPYMENHHSHHHHRQMEPIDHRTDEDVGFFNSLLPHVRHLSPRDKFIFRMRVQQTLFELAFPSPAGQSNGGDVYPGYEYYKCETEMSD